MSTHYENTANKLRPKTFEELTGQEFIVSTVCSSIQQDNIAPAYLFSGPRGVGKTSAARLVALAINRPENSPVNELSYPGSEDIRLGKSLDVIEIDGASYTSVENVRNIREEILYTPVHFRYKVYIVDEVHMLSNSAFNALLKTIEEPPSYVVFIFATTELHKVPATIRSRCQQFSFRLISMPEITSKLQDICSQEHIDAELLALQWIAKEAQGSLRDAYTLFDQIKAFSNNNITIQNIKENLGLAGLDTLNELFVLCLKGDRTKVLNMLDLLFAQGIRVEQFTIEASEYVRNLLLLKAEIQAEASLGYPATLFDKQIYQGFSAEQLERALALLLECYKTLRVSANPRFELELVFSQFCEIARYVTPQQLVAQLTQLHKGEGIDKHTLTMTNNTNIPLDATSTHTTQDQQTRSDSPATLHTPSLSDLIEKKDSDFEQQATDEKELLQTNNTLWDKIIDNVRTKNESFALVLDSAHVEETKLGLKITFHSQYEYDKYMHFGDSVLALAKRIANRDLTIEVESQVSPSVPKQKNSIMNTIENISQSMPLPSTKSEKLSEDTSNVLQVFGGKVKDESN